MAFRRSKVLQQMQNYNSPMRNAFMLDASKMSYDPSRYGFQYSNKAVREGYEDGRRFLSRIPRYRGTHPELKDKINAQRLGFYFGIGITIYLTTQLWTMRHEEDRKFWYALFKDKEFVGRYSYKTRAIEFQDTIGPRAPL